MKRNFKFESILIILTVFLVISFFIIYPTQIEANNENIITDNLTNENPNGIIGYLGEDSNARNSTGNIVNEIMNKSFYIKNAFSGQYLDVYDGQASDGTNVIQYPYNGGRNQQWFIKYNEDGTFTFYSQLALDYVLDVNGGFNNDLTNVQLWSYNGGDSQKFKIGYTSTSTYAILSKCSNYSKAVVTHGYGCAMGDNVNQYTYSEHWNELWILEPIAKNKNLGVKYATDNWNSYVYAYPNLTNFDGDCTNFVSQCMLASGIHYRDSWGTYRKNSNHTNIANVNQLNDSWSLTDPSPWISAKQFKEFWAPKASEAYRAKGTDILNNPSIVWDVPITQGCVVQKANNLFGVMGKATHSMYITGYVDNTYLLTYHSTNTLNRSLLDFCRQEPDAYYLFYVF